MGEMSEMSAWKMKQAFRYMTMDTLKFALAETIRNVNTKAREKKLDLIRAEIAKREAKGER